MVKKYNRQKQLVPSSVPTLTSETIKRTPDLPYRFYGWRPDMPDQRDFRYSAPRPLRSGPQPVKVDLRPKLPSLMWDQYNLGSCTACALGILLWTVDKTDPIEPSRLFLYYNTRILEGTKNWDSGASIRNSVKAAVKWGYAPEHDWPYNIERFTERPNNQVYGKARKERVQRYERITHHGRYIRACLAEGFPITFGFMVYPSFESPKVAKTGVVPMPGRNEKPHGGHAVLIVGYDMNSKIYTIRNSWGPSWGDQGYCYMPMKFVHNKRYAMDFWTVKAVP